MSHYATFGDNEREFIERHISVDLAPESCICKAHQTEAKRLWADPSSTPKWKSDGSPVDVTCIIPECEVVHKLISLRFDATENIESVIYYSQHQKFHYSCVQNIMLDYTASLTQSLVQAVVPHKGKVHASHGTVQMQLESTVY